MCGLQGIGNFFAGNFFFFGGNLNFFRRNFFFLGGNLAKAGKAEEICPILLCFSAPALLCARSGKIGQESGENPAKDQDVDIVSILSI